MIKTKLKSTRDGFGEALVKLAKKEKKIVVVDADLKTSLRLVDFSQKYPERFIEVGVAEQNMMGVAAGLAMSGKIVFATSFACFSPAINWNNIRISVCYNHANVKIVGSHAGLATGPDGASHQALEDISLMRVLPGMVILAPSDFDQAFALTILAARHKGPVYLRLTRPTTAKIVADNKNLKIGGSQILRKGRRITFLSYGPVLAEVLKAASKVDGEVINCYSLKPIDQETILASCRRTGRVITIEDHSIFGGLGSAVAEILIQSLPLPLRMIGIDDQFGESSRDFLDLWEKHGLTSQKIAAVAGKMLR